MVDYQKCFIANLKFYRKKARLTQAELAEFCDVSNGTIGNIETGVTKPSFDLIVAISSALNVEPSSLFAAKGVAMSNKNVLSDKFTKNQLQKVKRIMTQSVSDALTRLNQ